MSIVYEPPNKAELRKEYDKIIPLYKRLITEIVFILEKAVTKDIEISSIQERPKEFENFYEKIVKNQVSENFFEIIKDIAGVRIICLYKSDIEKIDSLIEKNFEVVEKDLKTRTQPVTQFGYVSDHYIVRLPPKCKGMRYDDIKSLKCEIQVRTILMDAWASIAHHLDYKQEVDIPFELKRDFYALSGLFHVADVHFEFLRDSRQEALNKLRTSIRLDMFDLSQDINFDSLREYLKWKIPDVARDTAKGISEFVSELREAGYDKLTKLDKAIDAASEAASLLIDEECARARKSEGGYVRCCLDLFDESYRKRLEQYKKQGLDGALDKYISLISKYETMVDKKKGKG